MGNKVATIDMVTDQGHQASVQIFTTDSGMEILTTHQNRYTGKFTTYVGSGIKKVERITVDELFTPEIRIDLDKTMKT